MTFEDDARQMSSTWTEAWTAELRRRTAAADEREVRGAPWSEVRARLLRRLADR
jgi:hypothetical protein